MLLHGILPVPNIKGGAVESIINNIINKNEILEENKYIIVTKDEKGIIEEEKKYKMTSFFNIKVDTLNYKIQRIFRGAINRIPYIYIDNAFIHFAKKVLRSENIKDVDYVIIENHPLYTLSLNKMFKNKIINHLHNDFLNNNTKKSKSILKKSKSIYAVSNYIKGRVLTIDNASSKVKTLHNGIDEKNFVYDKKSREKIRRKYNFSNDDIVFIFSGRMTKEKGILELISVFNELCDEYKNIKLLIVGDYFFDSNIKNDFVRILKNKISLNKENIVFTGFAKYNDMNKYYSTADIQVIPSKWEEPCALTLLEGMTIGLPQIVTNSGELDKSACKDSTIIVEKNKNFEVNLKDAMIEMIDKKSEYEILSKYARQYSNNYTLDKYYAKFIELLKSE